MPWGFMRGYQKRVIYLKNVKSHSFEEAYFVLRPDLPAKAESPQLMIDEANRIIEENFGKGSKKSRSGIRGHIISFLSGGLLAVVISSIVYLIFG